MSNPTIRLSLVVAMTDKAKGIGINGTLPWRLAKDLKHFANVTTHTANPAKMNAVIMGRKTWFSIPKSFRPLPNRLNVIISSTLSDVGQLEANPNSDASKVLIFDSFEKAVETLSSEAYADQIEQLYAIGGSQIFKSAIDYPRKELLHRIYLTRIFNDIECDTFMEPEDFLDSFRKLTDIEDPGKFIVEFNTVELEPKSNLKYSFEIWERI